MKKSILGLCLMLILAAVTPFARGAAPIGVTAEGTPVVFTDAQPFIDENGRTLVPLRAIGEALGLEVSWDDAARRAVFSKACESADTSFFTWQENGRLCYRKELKLSFYPKKAEASFAAQDVYWNLDHGRYETAAAEGTIPMDTAAVIVEGRTYAPVRYLAEAFGIDVIWENDTRTVKLLKGRPAQYRYYYKAIEGRPHFVFVKEDNIARMEVAELTISDDYEENGEILTKTPAFSWQAMSPEQLSQTALPAMPLCGVGCDLAMEPGHTYYFTFTLKIIKENGADRRETTVFQYRS